MSGVIAFFPHNDFHETFFKKVAERTFVKLKVVSLFIKEYGECDNFNTFEIELELEKLWENIDISCVALRKLQADYPEFDFMRAVYSEREFNYYPEYLNRRPVSREYQLKYLVGCFAIFEKMVTALEIKFIISEMIIGMADAVLEAVAKKRHLPFYAVRQSKLEPGIIVCSPYVDRPIGLQRIFKENIGGKITEKFAEMARNHIAELREKISHPSYMEKTKQKFVVSPFNALMSLVKLFVDIFRVKKNSNITIRSKSRVEAYCIVIQRIRNLLSMRINKNKFFSSGIPADCEYVIYPLHYEPESSTMVRAFHFSDQLSTIRMISKALPLDVILVVKEHSGNKGYRKPFFYKELSYMPNIVLLSPEFDVSEIVKKCLCVVTLTGRMGWEAIVNGKPVIALGDSFWSSMNSVYKVRSIDQIIESIWDVYSKKDEIVEWNDSEIDAFAAAYIECTYPGNFVINGRNFLTEKNVDLFVNIIEEMITGHIGCQSDVGNVVSQKVVRGG